MRLELDIKVNSSEFDIYLSDDCGSGISVVGKTHKEVWIILCHILRVIYTMYISK